MQINNITTGNHTIKLSLGIVSFFLCTQAVLVTIDLGFALWHHLERSPYYDLRASVSTIALAIMAVLYTGIRCIEDGKGGNGNNLSARANKSINTNAFFFGIMIVIMGILTVNQAWTAADAQAIAEAGKIGEVDERVLAFLYLLIFSIGACRITYIFRNNI